MRVACFLFAMRMLQAAADESTHWGEMMFSLWYKQTCAVIGMFICTACLDGLGDLSADRLRNLTETVDLISLSLVQKGVLKKDADAVKAELLEKEPVIGEDEAADGQMLLTSTIDELVSQNQPIPLVTEVSAYLALRISGLVEKQLAAQDKKISRQEVAIEYSNLILTSLMAKQNYSGTDLLDTVRIIYAGLKRSLGPEGEKTLLSTMTDDYIRALAATHPEEAKVLVNDAYRDVLKRTMLGDKTIGDLLAKVMVGTEPETSLDVLLESLVPIDTIINGSPDARKEYIAKTTERVKSTKIETVNIDKTRSDLSNSSKIVADTIILDPPKLVLIQPANLYQEVKPTCEVEQDDKDYIIEYRWFINRASLENEIRKELITSIARGDVVRCEARLTDGKNRSEWMQSLANEVKNTKPAVGTATISPNLPVKAGVGTTLTCLKVGFFDVDGDELDFIVTWYVNDVVIEGQVQNALANPLSGAKFFNKNDKIKCSIVARDKVSESEAALSSEITIFNSVPSISGIGTFVSSVTITDSITCTVAGVGDVDNDPLSVSYRWTKNGTTIPISSDVSTISGLFVKGDRIRCFALVSDGDLISSEIGTPSDVVVVNTPPVFAQPVTVTPLNPTILNDLTCSFSPGSDIDGDTITYHYQWFVNGTNVNVSANQLASIFFKPQDEVRCRVVASDGLDLAACQNNPLCPAVDSSAVVPKGFAKIARYGGEATALTGSSTGTHLFVAKGQAGVEIYSRDSTSGALSFISSSYLGGEAKDIEFDQDHLYVLTDSMSSSLPDSLHIINVANPTSPVVVKKYDGLNNPQNVTIDGNTVYVADGTSGFQTIDITDKANPVKIRTDKPSNSGTYYDVKVSGGKLYVASALEGVYVYSIASRPVLEATAWVHSAVMKRNSGASESRRLHVSGNSLYVAEHYSGAAEWNMTTGALASYKDTNGLAQDIFVLGNKALVADGTSGVYICLTTGNPGLVYDSIKSTESIARSVWGFDQFAYVADSSNGILVLNISGTGTPPTQVQHIDGVGNAKSLFKSGNTLFVADDENGVVLLDVTDPHAPQFLSSISLPGGNRTNDVFLRGNDLYVASDGGTYIYSVTNLQVPVLRSSITSLRDMRGISFKDDFLFVGDGSDGFRIVNVSNPDSPSVVGNINTNGSVYDVLITGNYLIVADGDFGVLVYDVSTPANLGSIVLRGSYDTEGVARRVKLNGKILFVADTVGSSTTKGRVLLMNIDNATNQALATNVTPDIAGSTSPVYLRATEVTGKSYDMVYDAGFLYVASYDGGMQIINYTDLNAPKLQFSSDTDGLTRGIVRDSLKGEVFLADGQNGIVILGDPRP